MIAMPQRFDFSFRDAGRLADELATLASRAAGAILKFDPRAVERRLKPDRSPVTDADEAAQAIVLEGLARLFPGVPVIAEERERHDARLPPEGMFVLVDPLDGTREYLAGRDEFTVNIGVVVGGVPVFGCIAAPALGVVWRGAAGQCAERLQLPAGEDVSGCRTRSALRTRPLPAAKPVVAVSRSHFDPQTSTFVARLPQAERIVSGSSLKFCMVAEGRADLYPRLAPTHEWDVAAGHAIVAAAGGAVVAPTGAPLGYGRSSAQFRVEGFVAFGDAAAVPALLPGPR